MAVHMKKLAALALGLFWAAWAAAQTAALSDPTRPPSRFMEGALPDGEAGLRLQSVLSPKGGKATAIISGQLVPVGGKIGEARLVRLSETEAVLRGPKGEEHLFLTPEVSKSVAVQKSTAKSRGKKEKP